MDLQKRVMVINRGDTDIVYNIPVLRVRREIPRRHKLELTVEELQELTYIPGGRKLINKYLLVQDKEVCDFLGLEIEPEYFYTEAEVRKLLKEGTIEQLIDCLEFAPEGVIELIKKIAIEEKLDSTIKRQIISDTLKINLDAMIRNNELSKIETETKEEETKKRRSAPITTESTEVNKKQRRSKPITEEK